MGMEGIGVGIGVETRHNLRGTRARAARDYKRSERELELARKRKRDGDRERERERETRRRLIREGEDSPRSLLAHARIISSSSSSSSSSSRSRSRSSRDTVKLNHNKQKANTPDALTSPTGGIYIPRHLFPQMMRDIQDKSSEAYQRLSWDALRKSINMLVNKVNATNIKCAIPELFSENLIRGRGLICRSLMKSQLASPGFTDVFAALAAVVNTKFPEVGNLLLTRVVLQLKRAYKRNDKVSNFIEFIFSLPSA